MNQNFQIYYQRNQKINEIAGSLGGLLNAIFLLGKLVCFTYNAIYLRLKIIRFTFSNISPKPYNAEIFPKPKNSSKGSISSMLPLQFVSFRGCFPTKQALAFYKKGAANLHEYLDIRNIIKRLQDVDKLKMVLLNENQRKMFECIPKPEVMETTKKFSVDSMRRDKKNSKVFTKNLPNVMIQDDDPINKRIMELFDNNQKAQGKNSKPDGLIFFILRIINL